MSHDPCENVDVDLEEELSAEAVEQQRWIDGLLRSPLAAELEATPKTLASRVRARVVQRRRYSRVIACGLAAAAAILIAVGWTVQLNRQARGVVGRNSIAISNPAVVSPTADAEPPRATFVGGPDVIVLPIESPHPNVTVVRVFPVYKLDYAAQASVEAPAVTDEFFWIEGLNGG
jgi:hypothetical protein